MKGKGKGMSKELEKNGRERVSWLREAEHLGLLKRAPPEWLRCQPGMLIRLALIRQMIAGTLTMLGSHVAVSLLARGILDRT